MLRVGEWVWVDSDIGVPIGARVKVTPTGQRLLEDDEGKERSLSSEKEASLKIMHPTSVEGVDNMIKLGDMTEAGLLRNLLLRHKQGIIYTYTGSVLVAVNPYQVFPIYTTEQVRLYQGRKLGELPPHIFAIAESCYFNMKRHHSNQCCIISGESGAGKTESTKLILQYLAAISGQLSKQQIEEQILESNPILEAFGNAKTVRNDNSSRFGKYLEIFFDEEGLIEGARVEQYLLEKSRVCHQAPEERNYHVFYCLLAGATDQERKSLGLGNSEEYKFLTKGNCVTCEARCDEEDLGRVRDAMKILMFSEVERCSIFKLLAAILHLGNVCFEANTQNNMETSDVTECKHFSMAAALLEVEMSALANSLTHRSFRTNRERVTKPLSSEQAADCRDALVKAIYNKLFIWIVRKINSIIYKSLINSTKSFLSIGLLDIFGFENFQSNSFEQLCINFANEKLQQFFVGHIFKLEQKEYLKEDIVWNSISFSDNQCIVDLLAGKPCNLLALIDEESNFPQGSDVTMLNKINQRHRGNTNFVASKRDHDTDFGICHFAGVVHYESKGFLEKNRDAVSSDLFKMVAMSGSELLRQCFEKELDINGVKLTNSRVIVTPGNSMRGQESRKQAPTLGAQFRQSLESLMKALSACQPYFIRCFKPNNSKQSQTFDRELCMRQLRYSGMMDTIRIRKLGYHIRHTFKDFLQRYKVLLKTTDCNPRTEKAAACCDAICRRVIEGEDGWRIGRTKIFLKDIHDAALERLREEELSKAARIIQRMVRGYRDRKLFLKKRKAAVVLQKNWRACTGRAQKKILKGFARLSAKVRGRILQRRYQRQQEAVLILQTQIRGHQARKVAKKRREAIVLLQAHTRGALARRLAQQMRSEVLLLRQEQENQERTAKELQLRLEKVAGQSEPAEEEPKSNSDLEPEPDSDREPEPDSEPEPKLDSDCEPEPDSDHELDLNTDHDPDLNTDHELESDADHEPESDGDQGATLVGVRSISDVEAAEPEREEPKPEDNRGRNTSVAASPVPSAEEQEEEDDDFEDWDNEFSFYKFSILHFQGQANHTHIQQRLKQPLLQHEDEGDTLACLTVWWIILRFMEDVPEPKSMDSVSQASSTRSRLLPLRSGRRLSNLVGLDQKILRKNKKKFGNRKASAILEEPEDLTEDKEILIGEGPTLDRPLTSLEKLHIIVGYGLSRPSIRDEIYCQICKQLVKNTNPRSRMQGWNLLAVCLGIFPPTDLFMKYLESFISKGPTAHRGYYGERLQRIVANGERKELPCWVEFEAVKTKERMDVSVWLMDGSEVTVLMDSASTSAEVCQAVADKIDLRDTYGFSLYISLADKLWSLGSCGKHVLDAVSQCEQETRRQGKQEKDTAWSLSIRKELFIPWHDPSLDPLSTELIYKQVIKGMKSGEYTGEKEDDYVQLASQHYYIQFGATYNKDNMKKVVEECIATPLIENKSMARWIQLISAAHLQGPHADGKKSKESVKEELVDTAQKKWPLHFSKFYEVTMLSGPPLPKSRFYVAVNWSGIFFMDGRNKKLLELPYVELKNVQVFSEANSGTSLVILDTVQGEFELKCGEDADMTALIDKNLTGLRERSVFALAKQDATRAGDPTFLVCKRGDLLLVERDETHSPGDGCVRATNQRTSGSGAVHKETLQFLPTLTRPSEDTLELLHPSQRKASPAYSAPQREDTVAPVSLKEFSFENFRPAGKDKLWASSKEVLKQPLMRNLVQNSDLSYLACNAFIAIMKYMGDYPIKNARTPIELTDQIFGPATQQKDLQDEIYCQIMKQMTSNSNRVSMERGWQLMWLCTGLFPPSQILMRHTKRFLESRPRDPLAAVCLQRLQEIQSKEPRKLPPHLVEVEAIQQNSTQIFHKVHFPNDTNSIMEVSSTTTIKDLCQSIADQLMLSSPECYGLFLKTPTKLLSLEEGKYLFDSLKETRDIPKKGKKVREGIPSNMPSPVIYKRKLWFNVTPGKDVVADVTFHFPQELPKYLQGYHNCTKEDMINLGGLLFRIAVDSDRSQFVMIPKMLRELVPADQIKIMQPDDWKKHIISSYNKQSGITVQEAKIAFLRATSSWPTFGCAFYEVKQSCESSYPSIVLIAVSKQGVTLIDLKTKEPLVMHPFSRILEYHSKGNHFQMTVGTLVRGNTFVCQTSQGSSLEDLLRSYVSLYERQRQAFRSKNHMFS